MTQQPAQWLIRLYPSAWRQRYAAEALDLLEARPPTWGDIGNLSVHLLYTHLRPDMTVTGEESLRERRAILMRALRSSEIVVFCAFVLAIAVWLQFGGLVDGGPYAPLVDAGDAWPLIRIPGGNALGTAMAMQAIGVDLAFVGVLAGGLPLVLAAWRRSPHVRRYFLVPVAGFFGAFLPVPLAFLILGPVATINLTFATPITDVYVVWFVGLAAVSTLALSRAIAESDLEDRLVRFAFPPAALTAGALLLMLGATVTWGVIAHLQAPHLFDRGDLTLGHATLTTWILDVTLMTGAASAAVLATIRGVAARSVANAA
jgi:hypothetical protein